MLTVKVGQVVCLGEKRNVCFGKGEREKGERKRGKVRKTDTEKDRKKGRKERNKYFLK